MINKKAHFLRQHAGAVIYISPRERVLTPEENKIRDISYALKTPSGWAIEAAAEAMAKMIEHNEEITLIPMPSSKGDTSSNLKLAISIVLKMGKGKISNILGRKEPVESSSKRRVKGQKGLKPQQHGLVRHRDAPTLRGAIILIDNTVTTGSTFDAAVLLIPEAVGLAYSKASEVLTLPNHQTANSTMIKLISYDYSERLSPTGEWSHSGLTLNADINLLVGKNATGKTRVIDSIVLFAMIISGWRIITAKKYKIKATFDNGLSVILDYSLDLIAHEKVSFNGETILSRNDQGEGWIARPGASDELKEGFCLPANQMAILTRRNLTKYLELESLHAWAASVFSFSCLDGEILFDNPKEPHLPCRHDATSLYKKGLESSGEDFAIAVLKDMAEIGYDLSEITLRHHPDYPDDKNIKHLSSLDHRAYLEVTETNIQNPIRYPNLSQGMRKVLGLVIALNVTLKNRSLICLDDVGVGLDWERSSLLSHLIARKLKAFGGCFLMSSTDRAVLNAIHIDKWHILRRKDSHCEFKTSLTHQDQIAKFLLTGLANFDLLKLNFFSNIDSITTLDIPPIVVGFNK